MTSTLYPSYLNVEQAILESFKPGDLIPHDWLRENFEEPDPDTIADPKQRKKVVGRIANQTNALKKHMLRHHNILLRNKWGKGYEWVPPDRQVTVAEYDFKSAANKAVDVLADRVSHLNTRGLSHDIVRRQQDALVKAACFSQIIQTVGNVQARVDTHLKYSTLVSPTSEREPS